MTENVTYWHSNSLSVKQHFLFIKFINHKHFAVLLLLFYLKYKQSSRVETVIEKSI